MSISNYQFTLNLQKTQSQIAVPVTRGDTARAWLISLADGSTPYTLADGCLAKLEIKRPSGTHLEEFCPIENNRTVRYSFSQNANTAAVEGVHDCALVLYDKNGDIIGSPRFTMIVSDRVVSTDDIHLSDEDVTAVDAMIAEEIKRQSAEAARVSAETARQSIEAARVSAETERATAEAVRRTAETERAGAEAARANADAERARAEEGRALAEDNRVLAENQRNAAESSRAKAENLRKDVAQSHAIEEAQRVQNEAMRAEAESERAETERNRRASEAQRAVEENARARAENERASAERDRQQRFDEQIDNMLPNVTAEDEGNVMIVSGGAWTSKRIAGIEDIRLSVEMDADNVVTISLVNSRGEVLASGSVDLPLESAIVGGREEGGKLIFVLQSGDTIEVEVGNIIKGLVSQETFDNHKHTKSEITDFPTAMAPTSHKHAKSEITDFPTSMTPSAHTHPRSEISDFPASMTPTSHKHTKSEITDVPTAMTPTSHKHTKSEITDFPTSMTPSAHTHPKSEISDFPASMTPSAHNQSASTITAGTFGGQVVANASGQAVGTSLLRNSKLVNAETNPTVNGEICWQYE